MITQKYDVIVVGAGHAGCEAAAAAAKLGSKTLLITMNMQTIAQMSCNPAMGGVAKGQIVREIDALGGLSGVVTDKTMIQFRMLNLSKGPAMWSPRVQSDRMRFAEEWRLQLESIENLDFYQEMVNGLIVENDRVVGVETSTGLRFDSQTVILTNGTFLNGLIHIGEKQLGGGRSGERASKGLTEQLVSLGFESGRMKTGTPPRVDGRSLDYSKMEEQKGDVDPGKFSFLDSTSGLKEQRSCHITYTNLKTHELLREGFDRSPMFNGSIGGSGPRYCPSVEDKVNRFADKDRHQIFVEPEGWNTVEIYVNGFSTSLPQEVQIKAMRSIVGFEKAKIFRPGYAIEYDYFPPTQLKHTLETKLVKGLFFAGQINGTTGYEEAASQGLMAGINAHNLVNDKGDFILGRDEAYIGVLIDDLITKGTDEPYRMFTSRAEYRILLRQDNADERLTEKGFDIGLAGRDRMDALEAKRAQGKLVYNFVKKHSVNPEEAKPMLEAVGSAPLKQKVKLESVLARPQLGIKDLVQIESVASDPVFLGATTEVLQQVEIRVKYQGYIDKEKQSAERLTRLEGLSIPTSFDYHALKSLSSEAKEKLTKIRPTTISQAKRISGVSPSDISVILVFMGR